MDLEKETFLRVLKGAPLSVLLCLWVHGSMSRQDIVQKTGWKKDSVIDALSFLDDLKLVVRPHYREWALSDSFYQLPLPLGDNSKKPGFLIDAGGAEVRKNRISMILDEKPEVRKNRTSRPEVRKNRISALVVSRRSTTTTRETPPLAQTPPAPTSWLLVLDQGLGSRSGRHWRRCRTLLRRGRSMWRGMCVRRGRMGSGSGQRFGEWNRVGRCRRKKRPLMTRFVSKYLTTLNTLLSHRRNEHDAEETTTKETSAIQDST